MKTSAKFNTALFLIILVATLFRLLAVNWGLPYRFHDDETNYTEMALRFGIGKFDPAHFTHGTLYPGILFFVYGLYFLVGKTVGLFSSLDGFMLAYLRDPSIFSILARLIVNIFSIGTLYLTYLIGKELFNRKVGLLASLFLSFSIIHYMMSVTGLADIPAVFLLLLSSYLLLKYYFSNQLSAGLRYFWFSGFTLGLAMAAKLLTAPGVFIYLFIYLYKEKKLSKILNLNLLIGLALVILGFFIAEPFPFINPGVFFKTINNASRYFSGFEKIYTPAFTYFFECLPNALGSISTCVFFTGILYFLHKRTKNALLILVFPLAHFLPFIKGVGFSYYLLPSLAFICLIISAFLYEISLKFKRCRVILLYTFTFICLLSPALNSFRYYLVITSKDTRVIAKEWIEQNIKKGKSIILEGALGNELILGPKLNEDLESLQDSLSWTVDQGGSGRFQKALIENYDDRGQSYRLYKVSLNFIEEERKDISNTNADYLVTCGFFDLGLGHLERFRGKGKLRPETYYQTRQERRDVLAAIEKKFLLIKEIKPFPEFRLFYPLFFTADYRALRGIDIFKDRSRISPGPEIKIYERKK
ncbi:ArnT family glycosyltransferase [Candidatus Omnitrophota bacterium]